MDNLFIMTKKGNKVAQQAKSIWDLELKAGNSISGYCRYVSCFFLMFFPQIYILSGSKLIGLFLYLLHRKHNDAILFLGQINIL